MTEPGLSTLQARYARAPAALREAPDILVDGYDRKDEHSKGEVRQLMAALTRAYYELDIVPPSRRGKRMAGRDGTPSTSLAIT